VDRQTDKLRVRLAAALALLLIAGCGSGHAPPAPVRLEPLADRVVAAGVPGALVLVHDAAGERTAAAGVADLGTRRPLRATTPFRIASLTKTFTAELALQLADEGRLDLGRRVGRRTVLHLLRHRTAAGRFAYRNENYIRLGAILEAAAGEEYGRLLGRRIGLRTVAYADGARVPAGTARGYVPGMHDGFLRRVRPEDDATARASGFGAAGAIVAGAPDLAAFLRAELRGRHAAAMRPPPIPAGMNRTYGIGLMRVRLPCGDAVGHTGALAGTVSVMLQRGGRTVVAAATQQPLGPEAEAAFKALYERPLCG
jgi:D-alanyl-D-alanine carboxypeptidase